MFIKKDILFYQILEKRSVEKEYFFKNIKRNI